MDAFETRMQFLTHLRRLTSAAQSINKVVSFLLKHSAVPHATSSGTRSSRGSAGRASSSSSSLGVARSSLAQPTHGETDLWECILEELEKASINARMNIFYMLDSLLDQSLALGIESYKALVQRDLAKVVDLTVPRDVREGILNRMSTMQVLNSWKTRRILPVDQLEGLLSSLRSATFQQSPSPLASTTTTNGHTKPQASSSSSSSSSFSRNDILRRIEDDRERHKRLRERIWVLPLPSLLELSSQSSTKLSTVLTTTSVNRSSTSPESPASPAGVANEGKLVSLAGYTREKAAAEAAATAAAAAASANSSVQSQGGVGDDTNGVSDTKESALDVEFEQAWEVIEQENPSGRLDESDLMAMLDENERCFGTSR